MATAIAEIRRHRGAMLLCREETDGLSESLRLSDALANTLREIDAVVTECDEAYSGFRAWADELETRWSSRPGSFRRQDSERRGPHCRVVVCAAWTGGEAGRLGGATRGQTPTRADSIRHVYATLLAVERMDYGEMPGRMLQATKDAVAACQKGEAEKISAKNF